MIEQGTDGLSRGDHSQGVMLGKPMIDFVPLNLSAFDRSPSLKAWLEKVTTGAKFFWLNPKGWFSGLNKKGNFIWAPPPAAGDVVVDVLGKARLKRPECMHIVLIPRLMTGKWRRHLTRGTDLYFKIDWNDVWNMETQFEPVLLFVALPFVSHRPQIDERSKLVEQLQRSMSEARVRNLSSIRRGDILRKFLLDARRICGV